jgi:WD40 repeat protein
MTREASATGRARGITALAVNSTSSKLLASSADHHIYMFDCIVPEREPVMYSGHVNSSFYVKSTFSPDGRFIMSGSTDNHVYIWDVANPLIPPLRLKGHRGEVSDVAWSPIEFWKLASSSDDTTVKVWTIDRAMRAHWESNTQLLQDVEDGGGAAEVNISWSQPAVLSEEDRLACHETMMFSDTLSSSQEPDYCEEDRSSAPARDVDSPAGHAGVGIHRMSPASPVMSTGMEGEVSPSQRLPLPFNGSSAQNSTPVTVQAPRRRASSLSAGDDRGLECRSPTPARKQPRVTDYFNRNDAPSDDAPPMVFNPPLAMLEASTHASHSAHASPSSTGAASLGISGGQSSMTSSEQANQR